jgi:hypothetical protein
MDWTDLARNSRAARHTVVGAMKIVYYKSLVCPRCIPTNRLIARVRDEHPEIEVEEIEVLTNVPRALRDRVMMLPTLIVGDKRFHHALPFDELVKAFEPTSTT